MGVMFWEAHSGIREHDGLSTRECREIGWGTLGPKIAPRACWGAAVMGENWQGLQCWAADQGEGGRCCQPPGPVAVVLSEMEPSGREQVWQGPFPEADLLIWSYRGSI